MHHTLDSSPSYRRNIHQSLASRPTSTHHSSPSPPSQPSNDDIEAVIQMATSSRQTPDGRTAPVKDTRTQLFVGNVRSIFAIFFVLLSHFVSSSPTEYGGRTLRTFFVEQALSYELTFHSDQITDPGVMGLYYLPLQKTLVVPLISSITTRGRPEYLRFVWIGYLQTLIIPTRSRRQILCPFPNPSQCHPPPP